MAWLSLGAGCVVRSRQKKGVGFLTVHDAPFRNTKVRRQTRLQAVDASPDIAVVEVEHKAQKRMGDVGAVVDEQHQQAIAQRQTIRRASPNRPLALAL